MAETTYINPEMDRTGWPAGPWDSEPDKVSWTDEATGLPCLIVRPNPHFGGLCGYVAVEPGHPWHGKDHDALDVDVHGGLTFSASCADDEPIEKAVCHVPEPGKPGDVWWFGFDCGHAWDVQPAMLARYPEFGFEPRGFGASYKTVAFVRHECEQLAQQLRAVVDV